MFDLSLWVEIHENFWPVRVIFRGSLIGRTKGELKF